MSREETIAFGESRAWEKMSDPELAHLMLYHERLCVPFRLGHAAVTRVLGHEVNVHEFGSEGIERLRAEIAGKSQAPNLDEILSKIRKGT